MHPLLFILIVVVGGVLLAWAALAAYGKMMKSRKEDKRRLWRFPNDGF